MKTSRLVEFDVLRVAAMLFVVAFFHLFAYFPPLRHIVEWPLVDILARVALGAFVFISGYLLALRSTIESRADVNQFLQRRFLRVYPLFFLTLLAFLARHYIQFEMFIQVASLTTMFTGTNISTLWFVTMLFLFYLVTPLYLYKFTALKSGIMTAVFLAVLLAVHKISGLIDLRLPTYLPIFATGTVAAKKPNLWALFSRWWLIGGGILAFGAVMHFVLPYRINTQPVRIPEVFWVTVTILALLPSLFALARLGARVIPTRPLLLLSEASFAMYLLHRLTYQPLLDLFHPRSVPAMLLFAYLILLPVTFLLALGFQGGYNAIMNWFFPVSARA